MQQIVAYSFLRLSELPAKFLKSNHDSAANAARSWAAFAPPA